MLKYKFAGDAFGERLSRALAALGGSSRRHRARSASGPVRLRVTGGVAGGKEQRQARDDDRRDEPGDGCQPGEPDARLLLCSENPLEAGNGFGPAGGQGGGPGASSGQDDQRGGQVVAAVRICSRRCARGRRRSGSGFSSVTITLPCFVNF